MSSEAELLFERRGALAWITFDRPQSQRMTFAIYERLTELFFDGCASIRRVAPRHKRDAAVFLTSPWAAYLADLIGLQSSAIWREVLRLEMVATSRERRNAAA